jgi:hypothetical protein
MIDYTTGKPIKLTQDEFLKRFLAERALLDNGPKNLKTMTSISNVPEKNKGFSYLIDKIINEKAPVIPNGNYMGGKATYKLINNQYVPHVLKNGVETAYPKGAIDYYKKDGKTINVNQLRLIDNKTKDN